MVTVGVAMTDIHTDDMASPKNTGPGQTPRGALQGDTILTPSDLDGMAAKGYIPAGTVLRKSMFQPMSKTGITAKLATMPGKIAIALPANLNTLVGGVIKPSDKVNIKASEEGKTSELIKEAIILTTPNKGSNDNAITIAVTPQEAQELWNAQSLGKTIWHELLPGGSQNTITTTDNQLEKQNSETNPENKDNDASKQSEQADDSANNNKEGIGQ